MAYIETTSQDVEDITGFPVSTLDRRQIEARVGKWLTGSGGARFLVCANPHSLYVAEGDPDFRDALLTADIVVPDGIGVVIGSQILGGRICERITGFDVFEDVSRVLNATRGSVFLLGSTAFVLDRMVDRLHKDYENLTVAGTYSPPFVDDFSEAQNREMVAAINEARPDVLWVGMTAPKQEKWIAKNLGHMDVKFIGAIGAVFDFYAGTVPRSPAIFRRLGMEWLPRFIRQPRRLWRRNLVSAPYFFFRVCRIRINKVLQFERKDR